MFAMRFRVISIFGLPIYIDLSWFVIVVLIAWSLAANAFPTFYEGLSTATYWVMGFAGAIGLFVCVLLHELGHALVARRFDVKMKGITLFIFGGVADMQSEPPSAKAEFFVAIGGPIVTAVLVGLFFLATLAPMPQAVAGVIGYLALINVVLLVFNAIPAFPLDGGRVLRSILWHYKGSLRWATNLSSRIGSGFGLALMLLALLQLFVGNFIGAIWWFLIGMFLRGAAQMSFQQVLFRQALQGEPIRRFMTDQPLAVSSETTVDQLVNEYVYREHFKMFPVTRDGELVGCVSTRQIKEIPRDQWSATTVEKIAQPCDSNNTLHPDDDTMDALEMMNRHRVSRAMVVDDGQLVGVLSLKDLLEFLALKLELESDASGSIAGQLRPIKEAA